jgi:hypothetical protein
VLSHFQRGALFWRKGEEEGERVKVDEEGEGEAKRKNELAPELG